jgi:hypothetical protein
MATKNLARKFPNAKSKGALKRRSLRSQTFKREGKLHRLWTVHSVEHGEFLLFDRRRKRFLLRFFRSRKSAWNFLATNTVVE